MAAISNFDEFCEAIERQAWDTEKIFIPVEEWHDEDGTALFFKLDAGEPPEVTSPASSDWIDSYYTHWMRLPKEFTSEYRITCIKSGIKTEYR